MTLTLDLGLHLVPRKILHDILRDGPQTLRPANLSKYRRDEMLPVIQRGLLALHLRDRMCRLIADMVPGWERPFILSVIDPVGTRGTWTHNGPYERDGFIIQTAEDGISKRVSLHVIEGDRLVHSSYHEANTWAGHCRGEQIIAPLIERLKAETASEVEPAMA